MKYLRGLVSSFLIEILLFLALFVPSSVQNNSAQAMTSTDEVENLSRFLGKSLKGPGKANVDPIMKVILEESHRHQIDPIVLLALIENESSFNSNARGRHGEIGLMQIKPETARWMATKMKLPWNGKKMLQDPIWNIRFGTAYLAYMKKSFPAHQHLYLQAYNMGKKKLYRAIENRHVPAQYSGRVSQRYERIRTELNQI